MTRNRMPGVGIEPTLREAEGDFKSVPAPRRRNDLAALPSRATPAVVSPCLTVSRRDATPDVTKGPPKGWAS